MKLIQWLLSKLFPYNTEERGPIRFNTASSWDEQKRRESEEFYCGNDGTGRY